MPSKHSIRPEALAAFMKPSQGRARLKLECLKRIARAGLDGVKQFLLVNAVETRLRLKGREQVAYEQLLQGEQLQEVRQMEMTWAYELEQQGVRRGRQEGRLGLVRRLLTARFGPLSEQTARRLEALSSSEALDDLGEKLLTARSLEELGLA